MAGNRKRPRKAYRPRTGAVELDPVGLALTMAAKLVPAQVESIMRIVDANLQAFRLGHGNRSSWADLASRLNVSEALAQAGIATDHAQTFERGQQALAAVHTRAHGPAKSWTLRGPEIKALDEAVFLHRVQLQHCSQGELQQACQRVQRRSEQAL